MRNYRALISVPIAAEDDEDAFKRAYEYASSLRHPGSDGIAGHLEMLGEVEEGQLEFRRVIHEDGLIRHLNQEWRG